MKARNIVLGLSLLLCTGSAAAQFSPEPVLPGTGGVGVTHPRFYDTTRTFYEDGFTYQADVNHKTGRVILYNRDAGRFTDINQTHRDGRGIRRADRERFYDVVGCSFPMMDLAEQIVIDGFSRNERLRLRQGPMERLGIRLIICPDTGNVKEVHFLFFYDRSLATIPVSTFRRMEVEIKQRVQFTPTDFGNSMNFIFRGWSITIPPYFRDVTPPPPPPPDPTPDPGRPGNGITCPIGGIGPGQIAEPIE